MVVNNKNHQGSYLSKIIESQNYGNLFRLLSIEPSSGRITKLYKEYKCVYICIYLSSVYNVEDSTLRNTVEGRRSELHRGGNLKSCTILLTSFVRLHSAGPNQTQF